MSLLDLGFSPGDEVIDSDLIGEIEYAIGAGPSSGMFMAPGGRTSVAIPRSKRLPVPAKDLPDTSSGGGRVAVASPVRSRIPAKDLPDTSSGGGRTTATLPVKPPVSSKDLPDKATADASGKAVAQKVSDSNRRLADAKTKLRSAANSVLTRSSRLKTKASSLSKKSLTSQAGARLSRMSDQLTRSATSLKRLADQKVSPLKFVPGKTSGVTSPSRLAAKSFVSRKPGVLGQILGELLGEEYDPATSERDPQTVAEAEAYLKAAQEAFAVAKEEEVAAAAEVKRIFAAATAEGGAGTGENPELDDAVAAAGEAWSARGDAGAAITYGEMVLAELKGKEPPPPPPPTPPPPPPPGGGGASGGGAGGGGGGDTSSETPPAQTETPSETTPPFTPDTRESSSDSFDEYGEFIDPFAGMPGNTERESRGYGEYGDLFSDGSDADFDLQAAERRARKQLDAMFTEGGEVSVDAETPVDGSWLDTADDAGIVGSYLFGTDILVGTR